jgi:hypothetical protein
MSARSAAFGRLVLGVFLCVTIPFAAHAQTCTPPAIQQIVTSPGNCAGEPVTLDAGEGWVTYLWSNEATGRYMTDAPLVNTAYTVTVTDANGCTVTSQPFEVFVQGTNEAPVIDTPDPMCDSTGIQTASVQPPSNGGTWGNVEWTIAGGHFYDPIGTNPMTETGLTVRFVADGNGPATLTARGQKQSEFYCWSPVATKEIALSSANVEITAPDEACPMTTMYAGATPPAAGSWMEFRWNITGGKFRANYWPYVDTTSSYDANPSFYLEDGSSEALLTLRVRDDQGCWSPIISRSVVARTIPAPEITAPDEFCPFSTAYAGATPPPSGSWMEFRWNISGGKFRALYYPYEDTTSSYDPNPSFYINEGSPEAVLSLYTRDDQGCWTPIATRTVLARTIPAPEITAPDEFCPFSTAYAGATPPPSGSWMEFRWNISGGKFRALYYPYEDTTSSYDPNPSFYINEGSTQALLSLYTRDDQGCWTPIATRTVLARTIPAPVITAPDEACPLSTMYAGATPPASGSWVEFRWNISGGKFRALYYPYEDTTSSYDPNPSFYINEGSTQALLSLYTRDDQGCWTPVASRTVVARTIPAPEITAPDEVCPLTTSYAGTTPPPAGSWLEFQWNISGGKFRASYPPYEDSTFSYDPNPAFYIDEGATQAVLSLRTRDDQGCWTPVASRTVVVRTIDPPVIQAPPEACPMVPAYATVAQPEQGSWFEYEWSITGGAFEGGALTATGRNVTYMIDEGATQAVLSVRTRDDQGCWTPIASRSVLTRMIDPPVIQAPPEACPMVPAYATVAQPAQGSWFEYEWSITGGAFDGGALTATGRNVTYMIDEGATQAVLSVRTRDDQGCWTPIASRSVLTRTIGAPVIQAPPEACPMVPAYATVAQPAQGSWFDYEWSITGGAFEGGSLTASGRNVTYMIDEGSSQAVLSVRTRDDQGCWTPVASRSVLARTIPAPVITAPPSVCPMAVASAMVLPPSQGSWFEYEWSITGGTFPGGAATASTANVTFTIGAGSPQVVLSLRTRDDQGCWTPIGTATVAASSLPAAGIRANNIYGDGDATVASYANGVVEVCGTGMIGLVAEAAYEFNPAYTYLWSNGWNRGSLNVSASGTYSVTVTNPSGCSTTSTVVVNFSSYPAKPSIATPNGTQLCPAGGSVTLTAPAASGWTWSNGATTQSIVVSAAGSYWVRVRSGYCDSLQSDTVVVTNGQSTITAGGSLALCENQSVTLTANAGTSWLWSNGATTRAITVSESGTYSVTTTNGSCVADVSAPVTVTQHGVAIVAEGPTTFCPGSNVTLTAQGDANAYYWSHGASGPSVVVTEPGTYFVTGHYSGGGCSIVSNAIVITVPQTAVTIQADRTSVCPGGAIALTSSASGSAGYTYQWYQGYTYDPIEGATSPTLTIHPTTSGFVYLKVTDATGCVTTSNSALYTVVEPPDATITPSGPTTWCGESSVTLTAPAGLSYAWSNGATTRSITVDASGAFSVTVNNGSCSVQSATVVVTEHALPDATITPSGPLTWCGESTVTLTAPAGLTYVWSNGATSRSITVDASGSFYVDVNNGNCTARSATVVVTENAVPDATITPSGPLTWCGESTVTLTAPEGLTYLWSNGATSRSITVGASGSFYVDVNNGNCTARSATVLVTENAIPDATVTPNGPTTWCGDSRVTLAAKPGLTYLWSTGATSQSIVAEVSGSYWVDVNNGSCTVRSTTVVVTENPLPNATVTVTGSLALCPGSNVTLTAQPGYTYAWSNGSTQQSLTVSSAGTYHVTVSNGACTLQSQTYTVTSQPATVITQQPLNTTLNRNQQKTLTVNATAAGGPTYKWYEVSSGGTETALTTASSTTNQLLVGPYSKKGTFRFRVYVGSATCTSAPKVPSNIVTVTVN